MGVAATTLITENYLTRNIIRELEEQEKEQV